MTDQRSPLPEADIFARVGREGFERLCRGFFARVVSDEVLGPLYRAAVAATDETMDDAERKLREFLIFRFGGPDDYIRERGHPRLRARHARFPVDGVAAERWLRTMEHAMADAALDDDVRSTLRPYLADTARFMMNRP